MTDKAPMGIDEWLQHGKKYGYVQYLTDKQILDVRRDVMHWVTSWLCQHCLQTLKEKEKR